VAACLRYMWSGTEKRSAIPHPRWAEALHLASSKKYELTDTVQSEEAAIILTSSLKQFWWVGHTKKLSLLGRAFKKLVPAL